MKLNRKGYMLVEIIISFAIAIGIAMYLLNLTIKFKNTSEDIYYSTLYMQDKIAITKNIMNDLDKTIIERYDPCNGNCILFKTKTETKKIEVIKNADKTKIVYGKIDNNTNKYLIKDVSYYEKELNETLIVGNIEINTENEDYITMKIPVSSLYDDKDYSIILMSQRNPDTSS